MIYECNTYEVEVVFDVIYLIGDNYYLFIDFIGRTNIPVATHNGSSLFTSPVS